MYHLFPCNHFQIHLSPPGYIYSCLEIPLPQLHPINIYPLPEPPLLLPNLNIIPAHLPLRHFPIRGKCPVLDAVAAFPFHGVEGVAVFVPELDGYLILGGGEELWVCVS